MATLDGKRMLVVGASSGIGRALSLLSAEGGASVAVAARRREQLESLVEHVGERARAFPCDVADATACERLVSEAAHWAGGLDAVVYAAGTAPLARVDDLTAEQWRALLDVNVVGAAQVVRHALAHLRRSDSGSVALLSSHTVGTPWPWLAAYTASKAALAELARGLRVEEPDVRVVCVTVGDTATGFAEAWDKELFGKVLPLWLDQGLLRHEIQQPGAVAARIIETLFDRDGPTDVLVRGEPVSHA